MTIGGKYSKPFKSAFGESGTQSFDVTVVLSREGSPLSVERTYTAAYRVGPPPKDIARKSHDKLTVKKIEAAPPK